MMEHSLYYKDIILKHNKSIVSSRSECDITQKLGKFTFASPVVMSNMKSIQTRHICQTFDESNWFYVYHRMDGLADILDFVKKAQDWNVVSVSIGIKEDDLKLLSFIKSENLRVDFITIDIALSYTDAVIPVINMIKDLFPDCYLIVGNGDSIDWIKFLEQNRVDAAKFSIGNSKSCRTKHYTGFCSTSVTDLINCRNVTKDIKIISDGGLTVDENGEVWIGDIAKSIALGADFVMTGSAFSRCINCPAVLGGYFGNSTELAKNHGNHIEGANIKVNTTGLTIKETMKLISDSLKSSVSYSGGKTLAALRCVKWEIIK